MGISIDPVTGRGIVIYSEDKITSLIKHIDPSFNLQDEDDLEICLFNAGLLDKHLAIEYVGNLVTGKDAGTFIKILSDKGESVLKSFGEPIKDVNEVCIM